MTSYIVLKRANAMLDREQGNYVRYNKQLLFRNAAFAF